MNTQSTAPMTRAAGITWMTGALLMVFFMLHHPSTQSSGLGEALNEIRSEGHLSAWVHGMLIVVMVAIWLGGYGLTQRLGNTRVWPVLGLLLFSLGTLGYVAAAMVSGFIVPQIGEHYAGAAPEAMEQARALLNLSGIANQAFANAGLVGTSAGILCWSLALLPRPGIVKLAAVTGILVGLLPIIMLLAGHLVLHLAGMTGVVVADSAWYLFTGALMVWGPLKNID